jgi:hypothetical protein
VVSHFVYSVRTYIYLVTLAWVIRHLDSQRAERTEEDARVTEMMRMAEHLDEMNTGEFTRVFLGGANRMGISRYLGPLMRSVVQRSMGIGW